MMARTINEFPVELLRLVLKQVKSEAKASRSETFLHALTVCRLWKKIGEGLLWTDITLDNTQYQRFSASTSSATSLTRSISITITPPWRNPRILYEGLGFLQDGPQRAERREQAEKEIEEETEQLCCNLQHLSVRIQTMSRLDSFSLRVQLKGIRGMQPSDIAQIRGFTIQGRYIRALMDALPPSVRHLEFDDYCYTSLYDSSKAVPEADHICLSLQSILPRLRNLRLRTLRVCEVLLSGVSVGVSQPTSKSSRGAARNVFLLNTIGRQIHHSSTNHCERTAASSSSVEALSILKNQPGANFFVPYVKSVIDNKSLTNFDYFHLLDHRNGVNRYGKYQTICERILEREQVKLKKSPYFGVGSVTLTLHCLRYADENGKTRELVGPIHELIELLEGRVWVDAFDGLRLPLAYLKRSTRFHGTQVKRLALTRRANAPNSVELRCPLLDLEATEGRMLLLPETDDKFDQVTWNNSNPVSRQLTKAELAKQARKSAKKHGEPLPEEDDIPEKDSDTDSEWDQDDAGLTIYGEEEYTDEEDEDEEDSHEEARTEPVQQPQASNHTTWGQVNTAHTTNPLSFGPDPLADGKHLERDNDETSDDEDEDGDDGEADAADWL